MLVGYSEIINKQRKKVVIIRLSLDIVRIVIDSTMCHRSLKH